MTWRWPSTPLKGETGEKEVYLTSLLNRKHPYISQHLSCTPERRLRVQTRHSCVSGCPWRTPTRPIFLQASWPSAPDYRSEGDARCLPGSGSFHISLEPMPPQLGLFTSPHLQMQNILALSPLPKFLRGSISCLYAPPPYILLISLKFLKLFLHTIFYLISQAFLF